MHSDNFQYIKVDVLMRDYRLISRAFSVFFFFFFFFGMWNLRT